jgi:antitoxin HigA-1
LIVVPIHPGRLLKREMAERSLSASALARGLGVAPGRIQEIVVGRRGINAEMALRLGRYFGNGGRFWLALQARYDLLSAERAVGKRIARDVRAAA